MRVRTALLLGLLLAVPLGAFGQQATQQTEPVEALRDNTPGVHAFTGATVVVAPGQVLDAATVLIRDGKIREVGTDVTVPDDATVWDLSGHTLYPGFIDAHANMGTPEPPEDGDPGPISWNPQIRSYYDLGGVFTPDEERVEGLRGQGFTLAHAVPRLGIFRGGTALVSLGEGEARDLVLRSNLAQSVSFSRNTDLAPSYPNSPMGAIALMRQALYDADWYIRAHEAYQADPADVPRPETNRALAALEDGVQGRQPFLFEATREEEFFRARAVAEEFDLDLWLRGSGQEYRIADEVAGAGLPLVLPLVFPDTPNVDTPESALN
ncbi:MAG: hypothetical protein ACOCUZ_01650, partial [bacterium]